MSGPAIQHSTALQQALMGTIAAIFVEVLNTKHSILNHPFVKSETIMIILSGFFAVGVNAVCFAIIGKTSAVTYQVVGHVKTVLILITGLLFFPPEQEVDIRQTIKTIIGIIISLIGIFMYTYFKLTAPKPVAAFENSGVPNKEEKNSEARQTQ